MIVATFKLLTATSNGATIDVGHGLKECGIEFDRMLCFGNPEFRGSRIKCHLQALKQNGMIDAAFLPSPAENPISEN